ncbi:hypothetical protein B4102_2801 [Heyndrickxia sporothermodurans]|uniref:Uncharacterized protein n=1 Tax=Heyndrickxia sporothermodurans TaxID=46224 RepID=A0A150L8A1_9BACI|nr:hypothetical protein B4102_2801 [Heyndrickxia sporothermodurans]
MILGIMSFSIVQVGIRPFLPKIKNKYSQKPIYEYDAREVLNKGGMTR